MSLAHLSGENAPQQSTRKAGSKMPPSTAPNLVFHCSQFPWSCENKVREKSQARVSAASCWLRREYRTWGISALLYIWLWKQESSGLAAAAWFLSGVCLCKVTASLLRCPWDRGIWVIGWVCVPGSLSSWKILRPLSPNTHNHSRAGIILIDSSFLLWWFLLYKYAGSGALSISSPVSSHPQCCSSRINI